MLTLSYPYVGPILPLCSPYLGLRLPHRGYQPKASGKGMDALVGLWGRRPDMLPLA